MLNITSLKRDVESILTDTALTNEQQAMNLSAVPLNYVEFLRLLRRFGS